MPRRGSVKRCRFARTRNNEGCVTVEAKEKEAREGEEWSGEGNGTSLNNPEPKKAQVQVQVQAQHIKRFLSMSKHMIIF